MQNFTPTSRSISRLLLVFCLALTLTFTFASTVVAADATAPATTPAAPEQAPSELMNPLGQVATIPTVLGNIIKAMLAVIGSITLIVFIYGGTMWLISSGNEKKIEKGKSTMIWASLGLVMLFASYTLTDKILTIIGPTPQQQAAAVTETPSACTTWGGTCVTLNECPGPASLDQCMRDYQVAQDRAAQQSLGDYGIDSQVTAAICAIKDAGVVLCTGNLQVCCKTQAGATNPDLVCADPNKDTYCDPCRITQGDGTTTTGYCGRDKRCVAGSPGLKDPLCLGDRAGGSYGSCGSLKKGDACDLSADRQGVCDSDNGTCVIPDECHGKNLHDICSLPGGNYGVCSGDPSHIYTCQQNDSGLDACKVILDISAECMSSIPAAAAGNPSACNTDPRICGSGRVCCRTDL